MRELLVAMFCDIEDFCMILEKLFKVHSLEDNNRGTFKLTTSRTLCLSEIMTIISYFQISGYRNFKTYYTRHVCRPDGNKDGPNNIFKLIL